MAGTRESGLALGRLFHLLNQAIQQRVAAAIFGAFFAGDLFHRFTRHDEWQHKITVILLFTADGEPETVVIGQQFALFFLAVAPAAINMGIVTDGDNLLYCSAAKFFAPKRIKLCTAATERNTGIAHGANLNASQLISFK